MSKPLVIDLFCGLGGWTKGFLSEGWQAIGFDIERHDYRSGGYPGQLVLQDVLTLHGSQFRDAACIVASPPCQRYSYMAMPWKRAKALIAWHKESPERVKDLNALFNTCFRIQIGASKAAGRYIPMVVENVKGAQPWVGKAKAHYGSYYLWGDVEDIGGRIVASGPVRFGMPSVKASRRPMKLGVANRSNGETNFHGYKGNGRTWFGESHGERFEGQPGNPVNSGLKVPGISWSGHGEPGYKAQGFNVAAAQRYRAGVKQEGLSGPAWFDGGIASKSSKSDSRKASRAAIAEIPFELASHIARIFKPS